MKTLPQIKDELKSIYPMGIDLVFNALKGYLNTGTDTYNALILLEVRYSDTKQALLNTTISTEDANIELNRIREAVLHFIDDLKESDLNSGVAPDGTSSVDQYNGEVFYRIPDQMKVQEETKCIVRIAYDKVILMEGIEEEASDVIKDLRISGDMRVELIDPSAETPHFQIRTFNDLTQIVEKDLYTEWTFYVKPLSTGVFPLLLKISVIEMRDGKERKRDVVLEEQVEILSVAPPKPGTDKLVSSGIQFNAAGIAAAAGGNKNSPESEAAAPAPETTPPVRKPGIPRKVLVAFGMIALIVTVSVALTTFFLEKWDAQPGLVYEDTPEGWDGYLKKFPGGPKSEEVLAKLDSIETIAWEDALASNDTNRIKDFLDAYPNGKHQHIAREMLQKVNVPVKKQLFFEAQRFRDSLYLLCRGGTPPYSMHFNHSGNIVKKIVVPDTSAFGLSVKSFKPGDYEIILQDALGSFFSDTIRIEAPEPASTPQKPAVNKKPVNVRKPANTKPVTQPSATGNSQPNSNNKSEPTTPSTVPKVEVSAVKDAPVAMKNAYRLPAFMGCDKEKKEKEFKCTNNKLSRFLGERIKYPDVAIQKNIEGQCLVQFIVEKDGSVSEIQVIKKLGYGCDEEAVRLVRQLPPFRPGTGIDGTPIRVKYQLPVLFKIK